MLMLRTCMLHARCGRRFYRQLAPCTAAISRFGQPRCFCSSPPGSNREQCFIKPAASFSVGRVNEGRHVDTILQASQHGTPRVVDMTAKRYVQPPSEPWRPRALTYVLKWQKALRARIWSRSGHRALAMRLSVQQQLAVHGASR